MRRPRRDIDVRPDVVITNATLNLTGVTLYEDANFGGRSKLLTLGQYRFFTPEEFNDVVSSIKVPPGFCAILFEHADDGGGYGTSIDLLEDCPDLSAYGFNDKVSYVNVMSTTHRNGFIWARNRMVNGEFVPGHWERTRADGSGPDNSTAVVSPPYPPHVPNIPTALQVDGAQTVITFLGAQASWETARWESAVADQMGVIGSDFRGPEEIGSACVQRASNIPGMPDWLNFWYPQRRPRDHRPHFKRTLAGKVQEAKVYHQSMWFPDHDVNIDVVPNEKYMYLITDGHPRQYTDLMRDQYRWSAHQSGQPSCDDEDSIAEFRMVEAELQPNGDISAGTADKLVSMVHTRYGSDICIYGVWIYDKGHCCHSEIHPAEQIWWRQDVSATEKVYTCCLFVDASKRYWWRDQMDDGTKLRPWAAPPIRGIFAIAFEVELGKPAVKFEVANIEHHNVESVPGRDQVYNLVYHGNVLVTFIPHNDAFKVSFENVGLVGPNKVRGFLVIETTVGKCIQKTTKILIPNPNPQFPTLSIDIPPGTDVDTIDQRYERQVFEKQEGRYMFTVTQTSPGAGRGSIWTSDLLNSVLIGTLVPTP